MSLYFAPAGAVTSHSYVGPVIHMPVYPQMADFSEWANEIWKAGIHGPARIELLGKSAQFINFHWTVNKVGAYTEYFFLSPIGKWGPVVQIHDNFSDIFFGFYLNNLLDGPYIRLRFLGEPSYTQGTFHANLMHGECAIKYLNQNERTDQYCYGQLHGNSIFKSTKVHQTLSFMKGQREGRGTILDVSTGTTTFFNYAQDQLLKEKMTTPQFSGIALVRKDKQDAFLKCHLENALPDMPIEWYLECLARKVAQVTQQPCHAPMGKKLEEAFRLPAGFATVERGAEIWESLREFIRKFACEILEEGVNEIKCAQFKEDLLRKNSKKGSIALNEGKTQVLLQLFRRRQAISVQIDPAKNVIFFQASDGKFCLHGGSFPHFEAIPKKSILPVAHRVTLPQGKFYYKTGNGQGESKECLLRTNGDSVFTQDGLSRLANPQWPHVEVKIRPQAEGPTKATLKWSPKEKPAEISIQGYLKALFNPPPPPPPQPATPPLPAAVSIPPATPATFFALEVLVALAGESQEGLISKKRPLESSNVSLAK